VGAAVLGAADALAGERDRARQQAFPVGSDASSARAAAISKRSVLSRSFAIELAGLPDWPRPHMVAIPPGRFLMGSPDGEERWEGYDSEEEPRHEVQIDHVFALGRGPVTVDAFSAFINDAGHDMGKSAFVLTGGKWINREGKGWRDPGFPQDGDHPATCLNWYDAQAFLAWLNGRSELTDRLDAYRLPSEAEWEYACRAGTQSPFGFGDTIATDQANFDGDTAYGGGTPSMVRRRATTRVGDFHANKIGLYDMHGNVWEWCQDAWNDRYDGAPVDGTAWLTGDTSRRVLRGGSWYVAPQIARSAMRLWFSASGRGNGIGFRLARTLAPPATSP
jgi:formylglycine-generating enzyme required for sulfatase activity